MCEWWEEEFRRERVCRQGEQHMQITRAKEHHSKSEDLQLISSVWFACDRQREGIRENDLVLQGPDFKGLVCTVKFKVLLKAVVNH